MLKNYHMTENQFLESILNNGLIPQQGSKSNLIGDHKNAIFYSSGYEGVIAMFFMMAEMFAKYRGGYGDIHFETYKTFIEMANRKQQNGVEISETLQEAIEREKRIIDSINVVKSAPNFRSFLGEGVCLKLDNLPEEDNKSPEFSFYNSWTTSLIPAKNINVVVLRNQVTGEEMDSKYNIVDYFIGKVPLDSMRKILYDTDVKESKRESHLLWQIMSKYYADNEERIRNVFDKYNVVEISLADYLEKQKSKTKEITER